MTVERGQRPPRPAQAARPGRGRAAPREARRRPGTGKAPVLKFDGSLRALRHRRDDQRLAAQGQGPEPGSPSTRRSDLIPRRAAVREEERRAARRGRRAKARRRRRRRRPEDGPDAAAGPSPARTFLAAVAGSLTGGEVRGPGRSTARAPSRASSLRPSSRNRRTDMVSPPRRGACSVRRSTSGCGCAGGSSPGRLDRPRGRPLPRRPHHRRRRGRSSLVMVARMVPGFCLAPLAGVLSTGDRKKLMVGCDIGRGVGSSPCCRSSTFVVGLIVARSCSRCSRCCGHRPRTPRSPTWCPDRSWPPSTP